MYKIYTLTCPETKKIVYVGQTIKPLQKRLIEHISEKKDSNKKKWINYLLLKGFIPIIEEIDIASDRRESLKLENYWICQLTCFGFNLLNISNNSKNSRNNPFIKNKKNKTFFNPSEENINAIGIKKTYNQIVKQLIENRNSSKCTQDTVASWLNVSRKKLIEFENLKRLDFELLCKYCDIYGIDLKLFFIIT
jgi:DNA-binding XRE family transcriptional regulator